MARDLEKYIEAARDMYAACSNDDIEIDDHDVKTSESDYGVWVQAWLWVYDEEVSDAE